MSHHPAYRRTPDPWRTSQRPCFKVPADSRRLNPKLPSRMESPTKPHAATCAGTARAEPTRDPDTRQIVTTSDNQIPGSGGGASGETEATSSAVSSPPPTSSPPYWLVQHPHNVSGASAESAGESGGIIMRDNESEDWGGRNSACWARSVAIPDYVVVNGSATNIGAFVVFNIRVETINVSDCLPTSYPAEACGAISRVASRWLTWRNACAGR